MAMNPRTHPRGARPDFTLPKPNPNPGRMTDALWWLVCMREALEPLSTNGGVYANKPGYHNAGENLPDHGLGSLLTDHSIRWSFDRAGPWWRKYSAAHDWTFDRAHTGNYTEIAKYTSRLINAMRDPDDLRPDDVYAYTIGQADNDLQVEGWNERTDDDESGDDSHLWHRHDSFRRNIVGSFWAMWKALTIDMGWTYDEWKQSTEVDMLDAADKEWISAELAKLVKLTAFPTGGGSGSPVGNATLGHSWPLEPGQPRTADWANMQQVYLLLKAVKDVVDDIKTALPGPIGAQLNTILSQLNMLTANPSETGFAHPIVAAAEHAENNEPS